MPITKKLVAVLLAFLCSGALQASPNSAYQSYVRGLFAARTGNASIAIQEYESVVSMDASAAAPYRELAVLYWQIGKKKEAYDAAVRLQELSGAGLSTQLFLGSFYLMTGDSDLACKAWEQALKIEPENETATMYLAAVSLHQDPEKAIDYWKKFVLQQPSSPEGYYQLGLALEKTGELEEARESFQKAASLSPDSLETHLALAQLYEKEEKMVAAAQEYELALQLDQNNLSILMYLGGLYFRLKNYDAAEATFTQALKLNPKDASLNFWLGILAEERKDWISASKYFEYVRTQEETPLVLIRLSFYYSVLKQYDKAIKALKRALVLDPQNPNPYYMLGLAFFDTKQYRVAERHFLKVIELRPNFEEVYFQLGVLYDRWGRFDKAATMLGKAIELNPKNATALNYLGYSYVDRSMKIQEGEELIKRALALDPENGAYIDSLGWLYYKKGEYSEAEKELRKAAEKIQDAVIFEHLGDAQVKLDKIADAWDSYQKALTFDPKNKSLKKKIKKMEKLVLPRTLQRKVLKRAVGNLLQVASLRSTVALTVELPTANIRSYGIFQYRRPRQWRLDILGSFLAPRMVIVQDEEVQVYPRALEGLLSPFGKKVLATIGDFFNTLSIDAFDSETTQTDRKGRYYYYRSGNKSMLIDSDNGTVRQYTVDDTLVLCFRRHTCEEGLYLPSEIEVYLPAEKIQANLKLRNYVLNKPIDQQVFRSVEE